MNLWGVRGWGGHSYSNHHIIWPGRGQGDNCVSDPSISKLTVHQDCGLPTIQAQSLAHTGACLPASICPFSSGVSFCPLILQLSHASHTLSGRSCLGPLRSCLWPRHLSSLTSPLSHRIFCALNNGLNVETDFGCSVAESIMLHQKRCAYYCHRLETINNKVEMLALRFKDLIKIRIMYFDELLFGHH